MPKMPPKKMPKGMPPKSMGKHMMPGGNMMSDEEMKKMMAGKKKGK